MSKALGSLLAAMLLACAGAAAPAAAATCAVVDVTTSSACIGPVAGNDSIATNNGANVHLNLFDHDADTVPGAFNIGDWSLLARVNAPATTSGVLTITNPGGRSGAWSATGLDAFANVMIAVKGGGEFALYLIDVAASALANGGFGGDWSMAGLNDAGRSGTPPGLSHLSIYTSGATPSPVPLPPAGLLLLAAVGGVAIMGRRRAAA